MSTFIIESTDFRKLSNRMLYMLVRNLFKHGVKEVKLLKTQVHLYLQYHPKNTTMEEKLGMLPVKYLRIQADNEEELQLFFRALQEFPMIKKYLMDKKEEEEDQQPQAQPAIEGKKIKILENRIIKPANSKEDDDDEDDAPKKKRVKKSEQPGPSTAKYLEDFNPNDDFESQIVQIDDELDDLICINN